MFQVYLSSILFYQDSLFALLIFSCRVSQQLNKMSLNLLPGDVLGDWVWVVVYSTDQQDNKMANMKRENKLYSYAEQLADIELKKVSVTLLTYF